MRFQVGQKVGEYEFLAVVEATPTGVTYRVQNLLAERQELLKVLPQDMQDDQERIDRFLREAKIHARLHHPNIAAFYNATRVDGQLVMTSELVEGASLEQRIGSGSLPVEQAAKYFEQALSALSYAHREGVVHRDIKPGHLIITPDDSVKITGFGLAKKATDPQLTQPGLVMGSVHYMSPEQVKGSTELDRRSDIYSLGVVLYETVTGRKPFDSKSQFEVFLAHVNQEPAPPSSVHAGIPPALDLIILTAMAKQPASRFQTAEEFRESLGKLHGVLAAPTIVEPSTAARPAGPGAVFQNEPAYREAIAPHELFAEVSPQPAAVDEPYSLAHRPATAESSSSAPARPHERTDTEPHERTDSEPHGRPGAAQRDRPYAARLQWPAAVADSEPPAARAPWRAEPPAHEVRPAWEEPQPVADWSYSAEEQADAAESVGDVAARYSGEGPARGGWESPDASRLAAPDEASDGSASWATQTGWDHPETEPAAWSRAAESGWGPARDESLYAAAARDDDTWPESESGEEAKEIPLLLRPTADAGAPRYSAAAQLHSREPEASAGSWFGERAFAGWTSKDILAVGALTFVIVAAIFFTLLTFLNR